MDNVKIQALKEGLPLQAYIIKIIQGYLKRQGVKL